MVTHYPQLASSDRTTSVNDAQGADPGIGAGLLAWMRQLYCGLHGHDNLLHFETDRMSLECASCGHQTPGWALHETPRPTIRVRGDARRQVLRPHLVRQRRIA